MTKLLIALFAAVSAAVGPPFRLLWILAVTPIVAATVWIIRHDKGSDRVARMLIVLGLLFEIGGILLHHWAEQAAILACFCFAAAAIFTALSVIIERDKDPMTR